MKIILTVVFFTITYQLSFGQNVIHQKFLSAALHDSVAYDVWLPTDWNANGKYLSVYMNSYGALSGDASLEAATIHHWLNKFPQTIFVDILFGKIKNMDYEYQTGSVGERGLQFISSIRNELIPAVEKEYKTTQFRAFIGQSYSSSYANYLFLHQPGIFNAYILYTPERLGENQPPFKLNDSLINYYNTHPTFYFVAPAAKDEDRRIQYAKDISSQLFVLDSSTFRFKYQLFNEADHNTIVFYALFPALQFIMQPALIKAPQETKDIVHWFDSTRKAVKDIYGLEAGKPNSGLQISFLDYVFDHNDEKSLDYFANYFNDTTSEDNNLMLFNTAGTYKDLGDSLKAEMYFKLAVKEAERQVDTVGIWRNERDLVKLYVGEFKNKVLAWNSLTDVFTETKINILRYELGKLAVEQNHNTNKGIAYLQMFAKNWQPISPDNEYSKSDAYLLVAKAYYNKKDKKNTKIYLQKALSDNPNNQAALDWRKTIRYYCR